MAAKAKKTKAKVATKKAKRKTDPCQSIRDELARNEKEIDQALDELGDPDLTGQQRMHIKRLLERLRRRSQELKRDLRVCMAGSK